MNLARILVILGSASAGEARLNERGLAKDGFPRNTDGECDFDFAFEDSWAPSEICGFQVYIGGKYGRGDKEINADKFVNLAVWKEGHKESTLQCMSAKGYRSTIEEIVGEPGRVRFTSRGHVLFYIGEDGSNDSVDPEGDVPHWLISDDNPRKGKGVYWMRGGIKMSESDGCVSCGNQCWKCSGDSVLKTLKGSVIDLCAAMGATPNQCTDLSKKDCNRDQQCEWDGECIYKKVW